MIRMSTVGARGLALRRPRGAHLIASVDVEWTKNYRVRGGNVPFCYSVVYLVVPRGAIAGDDLPFQYTSVYVENEQETAALVSAAAAELRACRQAADLMVGHQLSSDLAVLASAAGSAGTAESATREEIAAARQAWHARRVAPLAGRAVLDTRYDADEVLGCQSRRLVDVCTDLGLDVTQPELRGVSMTALHRQWLATSAPAARERITVLNLRHSLSAALVALRATGRAHWHGQLNVNRVLAAGLGDGLSWTSSPTFAALL